MLQKFFTTLIPIKPEDVGPLHDFLMLIGNDIRNNPYLRFGDLPMVHFSRIMVIDQHLNKPLLLHTAVIDTEPDVYLDALIATAKDDTLDKIWGNCTGYPANRVSNPAQFAEDFKRFLKKHYHESQTIHIAYRGKSVQMVKASLRFRDKLQQVMNHEAFDLFAEALTALPRLPKKPEPVTLGRILGVLLRPFFSVLVFIVVNILKLLSNEKPYDSRNDTKISVSAPLDLTERESIVQNELTVSSTITPEKLDRLKFVLWAINLVARVYFNKGSLSGLTTIHFAHWLIYDNGKRLLFQSNYDGTWEQYIGDFVDRAAGGLDAIWENCVAYPRLGARDYQEFKKVIIRDQVRAQVFYSAYRDHSVRNILDDLVVAEKFAETIAQPAMADLLRRL